jgi:hypothetical protein
VSKIDYETSVCEAAKVLTAGTVEPLLMMVTKIKRMFSFLLHRGKELFPIKKLITSLACWLEHWVNIYYNYRGPDFDNKILHY